MKMLILFVFHLSILLGSRADDLALTLHTELEGFTSQAVLICQYGGYCRVNSDCVAGNRCNIQSQYYSQCIPDPTSYKKSNCAPSNSAYCNTKSVCCDPGAYCGSSNQCAQPSPNSGLCLTPGKFSANNPVNSPVPNPVLVLPPSPVKPTTVILSYNYIGCYADNYPNSRAMPTLGGYVNSIQICYQFALTTGCSFFGTQWYNGPGAGQFECWCTSNYNSVIQFGKSTNCALGSDNTNYYGGGNANAVYQISTAKPSLEPSTLNPSLKPSSIKPSFVPTTVKPSFAPTTLNPSFEPTTIKPSFEPSTIKPSFEPSTIKPSFQPSTANPSSEPSTYNPSFEPSFTPSTFKPSNEPSTLNPSFLPSSAIPSFEPSTLSPSFLPSTIYPSLQPSTNNPSFKPSTLSPSFEPSTFEPSFQPSSAKPSLEPSTGNPSFEPSSAKPTFQPSTTNPSFEPSFEPSTAKPSVEPSTLNPSALPSSLSPSTADPSFEPSTLSPSGLPSTLQPSTTVDPSVEPSTFTPSLLPSSLKPSFQPSTSKPSYQPSTLSPSLQPSTINPSYQPTTIKPSYEPSTFKPSFQPSTFGPTVEPFKPIIKPFTSPVAYYSYIGCYADNYPNSRAMPTFGGNIISIQICYQFALTTGCSFFGTQWYNGPGAGQFECWCTSNYNSVIQFGKSTNCALGSDNTNYYGGGNANAVYQISTGTPVTIPIVSPVTYIPPQPLLNPTTVGQVTVNIFGQAKNLFVISTSPGISVDASGTITTNYGGQGILAVKDVAPIAADSSVYYKWPLSGTGKGSILSYTVDISQVPCGCAGTVYLSQLIANDAKGQPARSSANNFYCDANAITGVYCPEYDLLEANRVSMQQALHICNAGENVPNYWKSCDHYGCSKKSTQAGIPAGPSAMGLGSGHTIDTSKPFQMSHTHMKSGSTYTQVSVTVSQGSDSFSYDVCTANSNYPFGGFNKTSPIQYISRMASSMDAMVMIFSTWGGEGADLSWLDSLAKPACPGVASCNGAYTKVSNIVLQAL